MSRISFNTTDNGKQYRIVGGWYNPSNCYHLTVFDIDRWDEDDGYIVWDVWGQDSLECLGSILYVKKLFELQFPNVNCPSNFWSKCEEKLGNYFESL